MSLHATIFSIGIFLFFLPYFGFPHTWGNTIVMIAGVGVAASAFFVRALDKRVQRLSDHGDGEENVFEESRPRGKNAPRYRDDRRMNEAERKIEAREA